ncbi:hypothetical protein EXIGLDRAFT_92404 [Exidia glandulosa HHB12029]|uniref:Glutathione S-transferase UstS-like C-terminal domain-containing protein n=1 Tax=Exidia glandulosa HHB12029 TaxID=1314781 RepID=A0A165H9W9_EXIGL|nr:hypothetical protein EXIGLDRAFT_92404 [Exidia glandulosa HHB12029]
MEYLDSAYPDTPRVFSSDSATKAQQLAFEKWFVGEVFVPVVRLLFPGVPAILDDPGAQYFRLTREKWFGSPLNEWTPVGSDERAEVWKTIKSGLEKLGAAYKKRENSASVWLIGDHPTYGDFVVLSFLIFVKRTIRENEWEELLGWHAAFWRKLWDASLPYQHVDS